MNKKGSMELSVNSIVILVIAVVMLGLILTFVKTRMDKLTITNEVPDPIAANAGNPITLNPETISLSQGGKTNVKIGMYNTHIVTTDPADDGTLTNVKPIFKCTGGLNIVVDQVMPQNMSVDESTVFFTVLRASAGIKGDYTCKICAGTDKVTSGTFACAANPTIEKDVFVEIR